jgi:hypothetical protein
LRTSCVEDVTLDGYKYLKLRVLRLGAGNASLRATMLPSHKPSPTERPAPKVSDRSRETERKIDAPATSDSSVPLEPHWAALVDGATD